MAMLLIFDLSEIAPKDCIAKKLKERVEAVVPGSEACGVGAFILPSGDGLHGMVASFRERPLGPGKFPYCVAEAPRILRGEVTALGMSTPMEQ